MKKIAKFINSSKTFNTIDKVFNILEDFDFKHLDNLIKGYSEVNKDKFKARILEYFPEIEALNRFKEYKGLKLNKKQKDIIEKAYEIFL